MFLSVNIKQILYRAFIIEWSFVKIGFYILNDCLLFWLFLFLFFFFRFFWITKLFNLCFCLKTVQIPVLFSIFMKIRNKIGKQFIVFQVMECCIHESKVAESLERSPVLLIDFRQMYHQIRLQNFIVADNSAQIFCVRFADIRYIIELVNHTAPYYITTKPPLCAYFHISLIS